MRVNTGILLIILLLGAARNLAHDCIDAGVELNPLHNVSLLFLRSGEESRELWKYNFRDRQASHTGINLPRGAIQPALSPNGDLLAYALIAEMRIEIHIINLAAARSGSHVTVSTSSEYVIDLRWLDDRQLGFEGSHNPPEHTVVGVDGSVNISRANISIIDDSWVVEYSPGFAYAAFIELWGDEPIIFWDISRNQPIESAVEIPVDWVTTSRDFTWSVGDVDFLIMNDDLNWFAFSIPDDTFQQLTNVGDTYRLRAPIVAPDTDSIVFRVYDAEPSHAESSIAVHRDQGLLFTCFRVGSAQFLIDQNGWDSEGRYLAFTMFDYIRDDTRIYLLDAETAALSNIFSWAEADGGAVILGWVEAD